MTARHLRSVRCVQLGLLVAAGCVAGAALAGPGKVPSFQAAFRREQAELRLTLAGLRGDLAAEKTRHASRRKVLAAAIASLTRQVATLRRDNDALAEQLRGVKEQRSSEEETGQLLGATLRLARRKLASHEETPVKASTLEQNLVSVIASGAGLVERFGTVHADRGVFYAADGRSLEGRILRIGRVGALGVSGEEGGVLARAPGGGLRVHAPAGLHAARQVLSGERVESLPVFLFDPECEGTHAHKRPTFLQTTRAGGPIAWVILGLALLGLLLIVERVVTLGRMSNRRGRDLPALVQRIERGELEEARTTLPGMGAMTQVVTTILDHHRERRTALEERAAEAVLKILPRAERSMSLLAVIVTVAPLLGLLGTVTGMITTFDVITEHGTGDPKLLSHGISEALITTKLGLAVAVPLLLLKTFLSRWADRLVESIQTTALSVINALDAAGDDHPVAAVRPLPADHAAAPGST